MPSTQTLFDLLLPSLESIGLWSYWLIGLAALLEAFFLTGIVLPGSVVVILGGALVQRGDLDFGDLIWFVAAGSWIGAGISLIEVQQNSDVTYRLYDYGRPRELHLDAGLKVAKGEPYPAQLHRYVPAQGSEQLVEGPHFRLDRLEGAPAAQVLARYHGALLVLPLDQPLRVHGEMILPGDCALAETLGAVEFVEGLSLITQPLG